MSIEEARMMAAAEEAWEYPLLSWKGMQLWSVGCRAPAICEIFMGLKAKKLSSLISPHSHHKNSKKRRKRREDGLHLSEDANAADDPQPPSLQLPHRHRVSFESSARISCNQTSKRNSDAAASSTLKRINADNLRRNSDASVANLQRLSTSSSPPCGGYERVWGAEDGDGLDYMLPIREVKLGGRRSDVSLQLGRQDSSMSAHRRSSCSSFSSSSSVASAASAVAKLASRRSSASSESEQRHLSQLVAGNQFLTHLTAAPAVATAMEHMQPSEGLLLDASMRCREAELKDRIIFFL